MELPPVMLLDAYLALVLKHPRKVLLGLALLCLFLVRFVPDFKLDASADSLVVEGDPDLEFSRQINARYGTGDFVFIAYTPTQELFSEPVLQTLRELRDDLQAIDGVASTNSILNVPLLKVANATLTNVADNVITLDTPGVALDAAKADLTSNGAYVDVLLNATGSTTALVVNFTPDTELDVLLATRTELRNRERSETLTAEEKAQLDGIERDYEARRDLAADTLHERIVAIRQVLERYRMDAEIVMGGVPMIADDLITFVRNDLQNFGVSILVLIIAALGILFRQLRYIAIPLTCGLTVSLCMVGLLGWLKWPVTVISSNFIALLLITTVSLTIQLIVRYREVSETESSHVNRLGRTLRDMLEPCTYTTLTIIVAFTSLVTSKIPPVIDFGWMMLIGIASGFVISFLLFPAIMALLPKRDAGPRKLGLDITPLLARFTERWGWQIVACSLVMLLLSAVGIHQLRVENSFIDYFDKDTDIYQGMMTIDRQLGGTTPLDVVIDLARPNPFGDSPAFDDEPQFGDASEFDDDEPAFGDAAEFADEDEGADDAAAYWFTSDKMKLVTDIHNYLDALPETGKVLSLATLLNIAYGLNDDRPLNSIELAVLYNRIPADYKETLLRPYVSVENNQVRYSLRIRETDPGLVRNELLTRIREGLVSNFNLDPSQVHLTGMLVLYNNMLQSLFESQILTLGLALGITFLMFLVLFRSVKLAFICVIPTLIVTLVVLGLMGWLGIPLDMMTITIAAISVGIGVDNTIYYTHRFKKSFSRFGNYRDTMHYCHASIGKAIYYTNFTIIAGFSILALSNFVPTVYFGLLTSLSMLMSLAGSLTVLPHLLVTFKPLGPESAV
jgi:predicted RND superfamily exporter protein